jgi:hypothetical protein
MLGKLGRNVFEGKKNKGIVRALIGIGIVKTNLGR